MTMKIRTSSRIDFFHFEADIFAIDKMPRETIVRPLDFARVERIFDHESPPYIQIHVLLSGHFFLMPIGPNEMAHFWYNMEVEIFKCSKFELSGNAAPWK